MDKINLSRLLLNFFTIFIIFSHLSIFYVCYSCCYLVAKSCLTLCNSMDWSLQSSSVHGISQASILEWVAISYSRRTLEKNKLYHGTHRGAAACWPTNSWNLKHLSSWLLIWAYNRDSLFVFFFVLFMAFFFFKKHFIVFPFSCIGQNVHLDFSIRC